jgi:hypothetical protein
LIAGDERFFPPQDEPDADAAGQTTAAASSDHNYSENRALCDAIAAGARGAYWDILRHLK